MNERARRILAEARATIARTADIGAADAVVVTPIDPLSKWREQARAQKQREAEGLRNMRAEEAQAQKLVDLEAWQTEKFFEGWLAERLKDERHNVVMGIGAELAEMLKAQRAEARADLEFEIRALRIELIELAEVTTELTKALGARQRVADVIELPRRNTN